ncbi:MAG: TolC family protein [Prevotellaceae bacterium]|jgi:outer membrane protein TolC|nr:TolC family protein [Prevotellaceae bacterium]
MNRVFLLFTLILTGLHGGLAAQNNLTLTIDEVIALAKEQSLAAIQAKHSFRASYWQNKTYRTNSLPSLVFAATLPNFSRAMTAVQQPDGTYVYHQDFSSRMSTALSVEQGVPLTGGNLSIGSDLGRTDNFGGNAYHQYVSTPINIAYRQSLFGINAYKWDRKIEPLRYEEAKKNYLMAMEQVTLTAINYFFNLANTQQRVAISEFNKANNDSLFRIARGRYNIGTIGENDMLQSEYNYVSSSASLNQSLLDLETSKNRLRSFLGFNESVNITIVIPVDVPKVMLDIDRIVELAKENNPQILAYERQLIEAQRTVAQVKSQNGFNADLSVQFGLNQRSGMQGQSGTIPEAYKKPGDMERVGLSLRIPILDWGRGRGRIKMAESNQEMEKVRIQQALADFEQGVIMQVKQYNMQYTQLQITAKADTIARNRYAISMQRYKIDKIDITEMDNAQRARDNAVIEYVSAMSRYWEYYYAIRRTTLFDFLRNQPLETDYDKLVE